MLRLAARTARRCWQRRRRRICTGLIQDALLAYGSLRVLADDLAAAGYATLRFDYPGTGDSATMLPKRTVTGLLGSEASMTLQIGCARQPAQRLCWWACAWHDLGDPRGGRREDVAALLLFEPVMSGRNYVRN